MFKIFALAAAVFAGAGMVGVRVVHFLCDVVGLPITAPPPFHGG